MKNIKMIVVILLSIVSYSINSQEMTNADLEKIFYVVSDSLRGEKGNWQFMINGRVIACITDEKHNRMRILTPIVEQKELSSEDKSKLLEANFHSALDARYAISEGVVWSIFIHPLQELSKDEVLNAIYQVFSAAETYGDTYSSSSLTFPKPKKEEKEIFKKTKM